MPDWWFRCTIYNFFGDGGFFCSFFQPNNNDQLYRKQRPGTWKSLCWISKWFILFFFVFFEWKHCWLSGSAHTGLCCCLTVAWCKPWRDLDNWFLSPRSLQDQHTVGRKLILYTQRDCSSVTDQTKAVQFTDVLVGRFSFFFLIILPARIFLVSNNGHSTLLHSLYAPG